jgi:uncharacterized alkaline shock family protein YloU
MRSAHDQLGVVRAEEGHPMSQSSSTSRSSSTGATVATPGAAATGSGAGTALQTSQGTTSIADQVVSKIAGIASREITGVHALGGSAGRAIGSLRERIPGAKTNHSQGVSVEVGDKQAAVDVTLIAEYGVAIADLASGVRRNVISSVERMTGLQVTEVNVEVADVYVPGQDDNGDDSSDDQRGSRVQ